MHHQILEMAIYGHGDCMLKKKVNGAWNYLSFVKKKVSGSWADCDTLKKYFNGAWSTVWEKKFLDFDFSGIPNPYFSYVTGADSVANGNITVKLGQRQSNNDGFSRIHVQHGLQIGETVFIDYSFTNSNTNDYYIRLSLGYNNRGYVYPGPDIVDTEYNRQTGTISGTASYTFNDSYYDYFSFGVYNDNTTASYNLGTLKISKIYSDAKIYYWATETIKTFQ